MSDPEALSPNGDGIIMVGTTVGGAHIATVYKDGFIIYDTYQLSYSVLYFIVSYHCTTATILLVTYQSHS